MLKHLMVKQGYWLFRWRSYLPLLILPLAVEAFMASGWMARRIGPFGEDVWDAFCLILALMGLAVRVLTVGFVPRGTSGRNTGRQKAEALNTTGMYSVVRHPLYLGNFFVFMGFVLLFKSGVFTIFAAAIYVVYYERIVLAEEEFLADRYGPKFREWVNKTPVIVPAFGNWTSPNLPFSWKSVLRREFHTLFLIAILFFIIELLEGVIIERLTFHTWVSSEPQWLLFASISAGVYILVRTIRKTTSWLRVADR